jgi:hypothetical protein
MHNLFGQNFYQSERPLDTKFNLRKLAPSSYFHTIGFVTWYLLIVLTFYQHVLSLPPAFH